MAFPSIIKVLYYLPALEFSILRKKITVRTTPLIESIARVQLFIRKCTRTSLSMPTNKKDYYCHDKSATLNLWRWFRDDPLASLDMENTYLKVRHIRTTSQGIQKMNINSCISLFWHFYTSQLSLRLIKQKIPRWKHNWQVEWTEEELERKLHKCSLKANTGEDELPMAFYNPHSAYE